MSKSWDIIFDPLGLLATKADFETLEDKAKEQGEDLIQAEKASGFTLDLGWYVDCYRMVLIKDYDWSNTAEELEYKTLKQAVLNFRSLLQ